MTNDQHKSLKIKHFHRTKQSTLERKYRDTHPWITFDLRADRFSPELWVLLGEVESKVEHVAGVPLRPRTARELHFLYLAKGALATAAIEGNTLSQEQAEKRMRGELHLPSSQEYLGRELDNIVRACNAIASAMTSGKDFTVTAELLRNFNADILRDLEETLEPEVRPGRYAGYVVGVGSYRGAPQEDVPILMDTLAAWVESIRAEVGPNSIMWAVVSAVVAHLYLVWIHPFGDGNGRTARLLEFTILLRVGVPSIACHLLSNHYNLTRQRYYTELSKASKNGGDIAGFVHYAVEGFRDQLQEQIDRIRREQMDVAWRNFVWEVFKDKSGEKSRRQRTLVLDLSRRAAPVAKRDLRGISAQVAELYTGKSEKCVSRDVNELCAMNLLRSEPDGHYTANTDLIRAFLPQAVVPPAEQRGDR